MMVEESALIPQKGMLSNEVKQVASPPVAVVVSVS